jgi:hypothetical protein
MTDEERKLKEIMDAISKGATHIVSDPDTIRKLQEKGLPIESRFIPYEEYVEDLFSKKKKDAVSLLRKLPKIDDSVADGVIADIYEEIRSSYALSIFTSTIINSIFLLEYPMRARLYNERLKKNPNARWDKLEKLTMGALIKKLHDLKIITDEEKEKLSDFNKNLRNPYLHINIHKLSKGVVVAKLPSVNVNTQEVIEMENVEASKHRFLWFAAKRFFDKYHVQAVIDFCVEWTNNLLANQQKST